MKKKAFLEKIFLGSFVIDATLLVIAILLLLSILSLILLACAVTFLVFGYFLLININSNILSSFGFLGTCMVSISTSILMFFAFYKCLLFYPKVINRLREFIFLSSDSKNKGKVKKIKFSVFKICVCIFIIGLLLILISYISGNYGIVAKFMYQKFNFIKIGKRVLGWFR